jgi:hypothetical protein
MTEGYEACGPPVFTTILGGLQVFPPSVVRATVRGSLATGELFQATRTSEELSSFQSAAGVL